MAAGNLLNTSIGAYRLADFLGAGGMGEVYRAVHTSLGRVVALKVLTSLGTDPVLLERFRNEARVHAQLHHPHIATLFDFTELGGRPCIVMEYVDGDTLDEWIRREGGLSARDALRRFEPVVDAVSYLHRSGIIHRDIKSNNVKISSAGIVKLLDFGIAKASFSPSLTAIGGVIGTMHYLAPEQLTEGTADPRSDVWALGVLLYEMVTGQLPFDGPGIGQISESIVRVQYSPASTVNPAVPREVDQIIGRCLRRRPGERYQSADALLQDVRAQLTAPVAVPGSRLDRRSSAVWAERRSAAPALVRHARAHLPQITAVTAVVASLVFLAWTVFASRPVTPDRNDIVITADTVQSDAPVTPPARSGRLHTVRINVSGPPALVYREGRLIQGTPFDLRETVGERVKLTIRRNGFQPLDVEFVISPAQDSIVLELQPLPSMTTPRRDNGQDLPMSMLFAFPFGRLFGRRRSNGSHQTGGTQTLTFFDPKRGDDMPVIDHAVRSDPGCVREINEDSIIIIAPNGSDDRGHLAVVADGMGGHLGGEIASRLAIESVVEDYTADGTDPREVLARAVRRANRRIFDAASKDPLLNGMGTTCTVLVIRQGLAYCAHVGDSRLYLVRDAQVLQMTEDHSTVMDLVRRGVLTRAEAKHHPERNVILRALGSRRDVDVAVWPQPFAIRPGDRFLLCSDGLHDLVEDEELLARVLDADPDTACERLIALARERGAPDNVSVALLAVRQTTTEQPKPATGSTPLAKQMKETRASEENEE